MPIQLELPNFMDEVTFAREPPGLIVNLKEEIKQKFESISGCKVDAVAKKKKLTGIVKSLKQGTAVKSKMQKVFERDHKDDSDTDDSVHERN